MDREIFLKWFRINILFLVGAFIVALFFTSLFPDTMLGFVRGWGARSRLVSSALFGEDASKYVLFFRVFAWNGLVLVLCFIASLFLLAPLVSVIMGAFYSLGLMSAIDHFIKGEIWYPLWSSPVLTSVEASFILLATTFASALATEIFGVKPEREDIMFFWRKNWKKLFPPQEKKWRIVFDENKKELISFIIVLLALLLFGAWFEVTI